jgi:hypothetical protein
LKNTNTDTREGEMMEFEWINNHYKVNACIGREVTVNGKHGVIAKDMRNYIGVLFDESKPNNIQPCHPTSEVIYGEILPVRKMTRSQARYQRYLEYGDWFDSFISFCRWDAKPEREWNS